MVGQRLIEAIAQIPAQTQPSGGHPQELALRAQALEEEDGLQLEEDDRVDGGAPPAA